MLSESRGEDYRRDMSDAWSTKTCQVPGFEFDDYVAKRGHGCGQPSLPSLVETPACMEVGVW